MGDNAHLALESWNTLGGYVPVVGQPNELPGAPHDLGPLQFWLLAVPVHADPVRGVLWGAVLLVMVAASLAVEAGYAVRGVLGGLLAGGVFLAVVTWFPGFAARPEDNPNFGMLVFVAVLSVGLAVLSGHRKWWPVLVVAASVAAQAHLMFAAASAGLVLIGAGAGLADQRRGGGSYRWLAGGLIAGAACWAAPLAQQFTSRAGQGNMSLLLHADHGRPHVGFGYALRALASLAVPSPLWWQQNINERHDLFQVLGAGPAAVGVVILVLAAASLVAALFWLRSRELAALAAISLLVSVTAATSFALVPVPASDLAGQQHDLVFALFAAVLLAWLTAACTAALATARLISARRGRAGRAGRQAEGGQQRAGRFQVRLLARGAAALLLVTIAIAGAARQAAAYPGAGTNSLHVSAALAMIERSVPRPPTFALTVTSSRKADRFQVLEGLCWALTANGYHANVYRHPGTTRRGTLTEVAVVLNGPQMTVKTARINQNSPGKQRSCIVGG